MITAAVLASVLVQDCPKELRAIAGSTKSLHQGLMQGIPTQSVQNALKLPDVFRGPVATIHESANLRIFGFRRPDGRGLESLRIYGFQDFPTLLATIYLDQNRPAGRNAVHFMFSAELIYPLLVNEAPQLLKVLQSFGFLEFSIKDHLKLSLEADQFVTEELATAQKYGVHIPSWASIRWEILTQEFLNEERLYQRPLNAETTHVLFAGYLHSDTYPAALIEDLHIGKNQGLKIFLHPTQASQKDAFYPSIQERMQIEGQFKVEWLGLKNPVVIRLDQINSSDRTYYLIFEGSDNLPENIAYTVINPRTGMQSPIKISR